MRRPPRATGLTRAPPRDDDSRIASHSRAIRRPTSGGLGLGSRPARTSRNCCHTVFGRTERTGRSVAAPCRWSSRRSPQMPVRSVPALAEQADVGAERRDRAAAAVHRDQRPGRQPRDHRARTSTGLPSSSSHAATCDDVLAGEVGDGVEQVGARVEHEAAARQHRVLAPRPLRPVVPVLPHERVHVEDRPELAGPEHRRRRADVGREAALEPDDEQAAGPVAGPDQLDGLDRVHHHRLLEQDVEAGLERRGRLREVERVGGDDHDRVELELARRDRR